MKTYVFGLSNCKTREWVEQEWKKYGKKDLDGFVEDVLAKEGQHVLPLLSGDEEVLSLVRKRYLDNLGQILPQKEIRKILRSELQQVLRRIEA